MSIIVENGTKSHLCDFCGEKARGTYRVDSHARPTGWVEHWKNRNLVGDACSKCTELAKTWEQVRYPNGNSAQGPMAAVNPSAGSVCAVEYVPINRVPAVGEKVFYRNDDGRTFNAYEVVDKVDPDIRDCKSIIGLRGQGGTGDCAVARHIDGFNPRLFFRVAKRTEAGPSCDREHA